MNKFKIGDEVKGLIFKIARIIDSWSFGGLDEERMHEDFLKLMSKKQEWS